ncbi:MAG TPA: phosphoadenosine phosphosulfate reductase family protein [Deltaproteobacteria bacterium]|nr:phosphoadenosine phosphosulfate reductase family protein [Deltaproteobacteria bacterium]
MNLNYTDWKNQHRSVLETFPEKKVVMLYTGGKDSSVILSFLLKASEEFGFEFETSVATYPNHVFPDADKQELDRYWRSRGIAIQWHDVNSSDELLEAAVQDGKNPCRVCQKTKRAYLFEYLKRVEQNNKDKHIVVIFSFTLWDLVSYSIEYLISGVYGHKDSSNTRSDKNTEERFTQTSQRFYPLIELKDGLTIFKPLLKYNNQEILKIVSEEQIPLSSVECTYKDFTPKRKLFEYYDQTNAFFDYDSVLEYVKHSFKLNEVSFYTDKKKIDFIKNMI